MTLKEFLKILHTRCGWFTYGSITALEIRLTIVDPEWQDFRKSLKDTSTEYKARALGGWLQDAPYGSETDRVIQVTNYINALKRGGQIKG